MLLGGGGEHGPWERECDQPIQPRMRRESPDAARRVLLAAKVWEFDLYIKAVGETYLRKVFYPRFQYLVGFRTTIRGGRRIAIKVRELSDNSLVEMHQ